MCVMPLVPKLIHMPSRLLFRQILYLPFPFPLSLSLALFLCALEMLLNKQFAWAPFFPLPSSSSCSAKCTRILVIVIYLEHCFQKSIVWFKDAALNTTFIASFFLCISQEPQLHWMRVLGVAACHATPKCRTLCPATDSKISLRRYSSATGHSSRRRRASRSSRNGRS